MRRLGSSTWRIVLWAICLYFLATAGKSQPLFAAAGRLTLSVVDGETRRPIAARMHLTNPRGRSVKPPRVPYWKDHFAVDGSITLKLNRGRYAFEVERGPEYRTVRGHFEIQDDADDRHEITLKRFIDMSREGWWSGDLHVHRPEREMELLMRADDLHVAPVITWWNSGGRYRQVKTKATAAVSSAENRVYDVRAGEDERDGGALLYFHLPKPLDLAHATREFPSSMKYLREARSQDGVHIDIEKPFWWDTPMWLASGMADSIGLANNHLWRSGVLDSEAWGRPRDKDRFAGSHGNGRWSEAIYYHALNCGLRIAPSAGSASGVLPNPVGYNRVYVYCGSDFAPADWWQNLRDGRVFVTNGPLIKPAVQGRLPGHIFRAERGRTLQLEITLKLWTRDKIPYLEVIKNGDVEHSVSLRHWADRAGELPRLSFDESGWFLVRAVTDNPDTYRFASTGPYYVDVGGKPRVSRKSAQFFLDWVDLRMSQIELDDAGQQRDVIAEWQMAREFWQKKVDEANAP